MTPLRLVTEMAVGHAAYAAGVCLWINTMPGVMTRREIFSIPYRHRYGAKPWLPRFDPALCLHRKPYPYQGGKKRAFKRILNVRRRTVGVDAAWWG